MPRVYGLGNCPGDPDCPGYVPPGSEAWSQSVEDELASLYDQYRGLIESQAPAPRPAQTFTEWLKENQTAALAAAGGLFLLVMFSGARR